MTHEEASDLLASFALNAVSSNEFSLIQDHLGICVHCRAELDAYHEVTAALGNSVAPLPEALWETISGDLMVGEHRRGPTDPRNPSDQLRDLRGLRDLRVSHRPHTRAGLDSGSHHPLEDARFFRTSRLRVATATSAAVGAVAVVTVLGIVLANADNRVAHLNGIIGEAGHAQVTAAMESTDHTIINLTSTDHLRLAEFVLLPNGRGYLVRSRLRALPISETYQLWGARNGKTISLGILGRHPHLATFTSAGTGPHYRLGVSVEAAGGAVQPNGPMLASGAA